MIAPTPKRHLHRSMLSGPLLHCIGERVTLSAGPGDVARLQRSQK